MVVLLFSAAVMIATPLFLRRASQFDMAVYYSYGLTPSREKGEKFQQRSAAHKGSDDRSRNPAGARGRFAVCHQGSRRGGRFACYRLLLLPHARVAASRGVRARPRGGFGC